MRCPGENTAPAQQHKRHVGPQGQQARTQAAVAGINVLNDIEADTISQINARHSSDFVEGKWLAVQIRARIAET